MLRITLIAKPRSVLLPHWWNSLRHCTLNSALTAGSQRNMVYAGKGHGQHFQIRAGVDNLRTQRLVGQHDNICILHARQQLRLVGFFCGIINEIMACSLQRAASAFICSIFTPNGSITTIFIKAPPKKSVKSLLIIYILLPQELISKEEFSRTIFCFAGIVSANTKSRSSFEERHIFVGDPPRLELGTP